MIGAKVNKKAEIAKLSASFLILSSIRHLYVNHLSLVAFVPSGISILNEFIE